MDVSTLLFEGYAVNEDMPSEPGWHWYRPRSAPFDKGTLILVLFDGTTPSFHDALNGEVQLEKGYWQGPIREPQFKTNGIVNQATLDVYVLHKTQNLKPACIARLVGLKTAQVCDKLKKAERYFERYLPKLRARRGQSQ